MAAPRHRAAGDAARRPTTTPACNSVHPPCNPAHTPCNPCIHPAIPLAPPAYIPVPAAPPRARHQHQDARRRRRILRAARRQPAGARLESWILYMVMCMQGYPRTMAKAQMCVFIPLLSAPQGARAAAARADGQLHARHHRACLRRLRSAPRARLPLALRGARCQAARLSGAGHGLAQPQGDGCATPPRAAPRRCRQPARALPHLWLRRQRARRRRRRRRCWHRQRACGHARARARARAASRVRAPAARRLRGGVRQV